MNRATTRKTKPVANAEGSVRIDHECRCDDRVHRLAAQDVGDPPETKAPKNAARMADPVTQLVWVVDKCHWVFTSAATVPMTKRS